MRKSNLNSNRNITISNSFLELNPQTGTTYILALIDSSKLITLDNISPITVTIPTNASVAFPIGTQIDLVQMGIGKVTFIEDSGVTINSNSNYKSIGGQFIGVSLIKTNTDMWLLTGNLIA